MRNSLLSLLLVAAVGSACAAPEKGKLVFDQWCADCHGPGPRLPGTASLAVKYGGTVPAALEARTNLPPELIRYAVRNGVLIMPPFRKTEITAADLDALTQYLSQTKGQ